MSLSEEIFSLILQDIKQYQSGAKLLSEQMYAKKYYTSRQTIRLVLKKLEAQNIIFSVKGKGYFTNSKSLWKRTISFNLKHQNTKSELLVKDLPLDEFFVKSFNCDPQSFKSVIKVRYRNAILHKYSIIWINTKIVGALDYHAIERSVLEFLEDKHQVLTSSEKKLVITKSNALDATILKVKIDENIPCKYSISVNEYNEIIECSVEKYIPEQFELTSKEVF
ncbi:GntR family transcriptional regulator [Mesoplasma seiffertii]|uniref:UTRA domain-containing protein n=1 Tax=Mesoplasma seiffertii TaxID=28224 RepID=UPI00047E03B2|nr:GntR family transcriptional regulator [Mesoplasma seiffertii]